MPEEDLAQKISQSTCDSVLQTLEDMKNSYLKETQDSQILFDAQIAGIILALGHAAEKTDSPLNFVSRFCTALKTIAEENLNAKTIY